VRLCLVACAAAGLLSACGTKAQSATRDPGVYVIARVVDGDTVDLTNGAKVRLVQIDAPEVANGGECFGNAAAAAATRLIPPGTRVRLETEPATDRVDQYGRLLRYVIRARDGSMSTSRWSRRATLHRTSTTVGAAVMRRASSGWR